MTRKRRSQGILRRFILCRPTTRKGGSTFSECPMVQKPWPLPPQTSASSALLFDEGVLVGYFAIQSETERMKHNQFAILGFVLLLPATGLVTLGLLGQDVPRLLDSPFVVLPSLLGALLL